MTKKTQTLLAVGAGLAIVYLLFKSRSVSTSSSAEEKMKLTCGEGEVPTETPEGIVCMPAKEAASFDAAAKFRKKNYVDVNSNAFFQTVSTRDPRDIKV